jgi:hypothetical protein
MTDNTANSNWIDVTVPLKEGMAIWPGDIKIEIERRHSMERGEQLRYPFGSAYRYPHGCPQAFHRQREEHRPVAL